MRVYIVEKEVGDGVGTTTIVKVFDSKQKAEDYIDEQQKQPPQPYHQYQYSYEVHDIE